jgi:ComF family protein
MARFPTARRLAGHILDGLLPAHCILCGCLIGTGRLCPPCCAELPRLLRPCRQCALPGLNADVMLCGPCLRRPPPWDAAMAALCYEYPVDQLVQQFKFNRSLACGQLLADEMSRQLRLSIAPLPDVLLPVPLHFTRRFLRGFNQAEFLARELGSQFDIPVLVGPLRRRRRTAAQSGLGLRARRGNLRGAFLCGRLPAARVALVDDVLTTGATLAECARAVRAAGAAHICIWVAARVPGPGGRAA